MRVPEGAEAHLDAGAFGGPFGASYLLGVRYTASQLLRCWREPGLQRELAQSDLPWVDIAGLTASEQLRGWQAQAQADPGAAALLEEQVGAVAADFHAAAALNAFGCDVPSGRSGASEGAGFSRIVSTRFAAHC